MLHEWKLPGAKPRPSAHVLFCLGYRTAHGSQPGALPVKVTYAHLCALPVRGTHYARITRNSELRPANLRKVLQGWITTPIRLLLPILRQLLDCGTAAPLSPLPSCLIMTAKGAFQKFGTDQDFRECPTIAIQPLALPCPGYVSQLSRSCGVCVPVFSGSGSNVNSRLLQPTNTYSNLRGL
jgi:hypothetical protein